MRKTLLIVCMLFGIAYGKGIVTMETADCSKFADKALQKECRKVQRKEAEKACYKLEYTFEQNKCLAKLNQKVAEKKETQSVGKVPRNTLGRGEFPIVEFKAPHTCRRYHRDTLDKETITIQRATQSFVGNNIYLNFRIRKSSSVSDIPEEWMKTVAKTFGVKMSNGKIRAMHGGQWLNDDMRVKKGNTYQLRFTVIEPDPLAIANGFICEVSTY